MSKTVLITGASSGFGRATALKFADHDWNVVATMRDPAAAGPLANRDNVLVTNLDVTDPASIVLAIVAGVTEFGRVDAVINNAGFGQYGVFETIPDDKIRDNYEVNVFGVMNVMRAVIPVFRQQGAGLILNVGSAGGIFGLPLSSIYISTKFALEGFSESVAYELAAQNIVVKLVEPGGGDTPFHDRAAAENTGDGGLRSYDAFIQRTNAALGDLAKGKVSAERIANEIYDAATDGTRRFRYFAGYGVEHLADARRHLTDREYEEFMRAQFA